MITDTMLRARDVANRKKTHTKTSELGCGHCIFAAAVRWKRYSSRLRDESGRKGEEEGK